MMNPGGTLHHSAIEAPHGNGSALREERKRADMSLNRERNVVDFAVEEMEHDTRLGRTARSFIHQLRDQVRRQRRHADRARDCSRVQTDGAIDAEHRVAAAAKLSVDKKLDNATRMLDAEDTAHADYEQTLTIDQADAMQGLWAILAEVEAITSTVELFRESAGEALSTPDMLGFAENVEVASKRILEVVGDLLDPRDNRALYHEIGNSG